MTICPWCKTEHNGKCYCEDCKAKQREYKREYRQRPEVKAKQREYYQRPEVKARQREYQREYGADKALKLANEYFDNPQVADAFALDGVLLDNALQDRGIIEPKKKGSEE